MAKTSAADTKLAAYTTQEKWDRLRPKFQLYLLQANDPSLKGLPLALIDAIYNGDLRMPVEAVMFDILARLEKLIERDGTKAKYSIRAFFAPLAWHHDLCRNIVDRQLYVSSYALLDSVANTVTRLEDYIDKRPKMVEFFYRETDIMAAVELGRLFAFFLEDDAWAEGINSLAIATGGAQKPEVKAKQGYDSLKIYMSGMLKAYKLLIEKTSDKPVLV